MTQSGVFCADMNSTNTRQELARQKLVYIAPDDDQQNLMERGGPAIDREMVLGYNVYGTEKLVLQPGHQITRVLSGRQQSYATATQHATMELAVRLGANAVGDQQPALSPDGQEDLQRVCSHSLNT
jgi:hypothetical protein